VGGGGDAGKIKTQENRPTRPESAPASLFDDRCRAKTLVASALPARKGISFSRQATIGPYFVDFACHQWRIVIEVDGSQHMARAGADAARTAFLESRGYRVLRFWNNDVLQQTEGVLAAIHEVLREDRGSSPHP
jgi:very-short-patch-repair endonuclease